MVYLLHFDQPYKGCEHYIGFAETQETFTKRLDHHRSGSGARLLRAVSKSGISFVVAKVWETGDRNFERKLKKRKNSKRLCPICKHLKS